MKGTAIKTKLWPTVQNPSASQITTLLDKMVKEKGVATVGLPNQPNIAAETTPIGNLIYF